MEASTILIVEDSEQNKLILKNLLSRRGHHILEASDGFQALELTRTHLPALVLLDINMPQKDGYEVCRDLKADDKTRHIPVIFISALDNTEYIVKGFEVGGSDYITKPFRFMEVIARVENHLTISRQQREIELLRQQDQQQFEAINTMRNLFIGTATHDLKNPLMVILSYVTLMERQPQTEHNSVFSKSLNGIRSSVKHMSDLVTDMLDLVQMESSVSLNREPMPLKPFLQESVEGFRILAQQKNIHLHLAPPEDSLTCLLDARRMKRVMDNLLSNAIKYTPEGGQVMVSTQSSEAHISIEIKDTGIGLPPEAIPRLFEAFYRVPGEQHTKIEGTGLGLAIVKTIVEQHQGSISVESTIGQGSTFRVTLPTS